MNTAPVSQAARISWERANHLASLDQEITPKIARAYLAKNKHHAEFIDTKPDLRNPKTRQIITQIKTTKNPNKTTTHRPSKGDPARPPRAGAPETQTSTNTTPQALTKQLQTLINQADPTQLDTKTLFELKDLAQKVGGIPNLTYALAFLNHLQH